MVGGWVMGGGAKVKQSDRDTIRKTLRKTDRQKGLQTGRQRQSGKYSVNRQTIRKVDSQSVNWLKIQSHSEKQTDRKAYRQADRDNQVNTV